MRQLEASCVYARLSITCSTNTKCTAGSPSFVTLLRFTSLALAILGCSGCATQGVIQQPNGTDITNKVIDIDRDKDGKVDVRFETVYRGATKVLMITSRPNRHGVMTVWSRGYYVGGDLTMVEDDEDGDGVLETISVLRPGDIEVFTRQSDGSVTPISADKLQVVKKQNAAIAEFWNKALQPDFDTSKAADLFEETQQKIQDAAKKKTGDKK